MSSTERNEPDNNPGAEVKAQQVLDELKRLHPEIKWSLFPLGDYDQYAEIGAPEILVSFSSNEQDLDTGLPDPYSTMMGEACEPSQWGISAAAAQIMQSYNRVYIAKYPNCDGPKHLKSAG